MNSKSSIKAFSATLVISALILGCTPDATDDGDTDVDAAPIGNSNEAKPRAKAEKDDTQLVDGGGDGALDSDAVVIDLGESADPENLQRGLTRMLPTPTLLDADALTLVFQRIFTAADPAVDATAAWFSVAERKALGGFDFLKRSADQRNLARSTEMNLPYMRALRGFLGRGCGNLVTRELAAATAGDVTNNRLVRSTTVPTAADVEATMRRLFGLPVGRVQGSVEYATVFAQNMAAAPTSETPAQRKLRLSANYTLMCIALGMDPRAYPR